MYKDIVRSIVFGVVVILCLLFFGLGAISCRSWEADRCIERGGQPVVPAWWSDDPFNVQCLFLNE